jgi:pyruvate dehydrogenase E1 component alpha subunit
VTDTGLTYAPKSAFENILDSEAASGLRSACKEIAEHATRLAREDHVTLADYEAMYEMRRTEEEFFRLKSEGEVVPNIHQGIGQEAIARGAVGVLSHDDYLTATYRGHNHALAKGAPLGRVVAEVLHRSTGLSSGYAGTMHLIDPSCNLLFESAIVGGAVPLAVGAALSADRLGDGRVAMSVFGEGATAQGVTHEAMNLAGAWHLPVVFVCENNGYSEMTPAAETTALKDFGWRSVSHGVPAVRADGNVLPSIRAAARAAIDWARSGNGPVFIEASTYRFSGHYGGDPGLYRPKGELEMRTSRDPIVLAETALHEDGIDATRLAEVRAMVDARVDHAVAAALAAPLPSPADIGLHVYEENR